MEWGGIFDGAKSMKGSAPSSSHFGTEQANMLSMEVQENKPYSLHLITRTFSTCTKHQALSLWRSRHYRYGEFRFKLHRIEQQQIKEQESQERRKCTGSDRR